MGTSRKVFFSFDYERDLRRVQQIRHLWHIHERGASQSIYDEERFADAEKQVSGMQRWIDSQLHGCSVMVVLFGHKTYHREWVKFEIRRSHQLKKGILAIDIHNVADPVDGADLPGRNPLGFWQIGGTPFTFLYRTYSWVEDEGHRNIRNWIELAANDRVPRGL